MGAYVALGEVTTLDHESANDTVELGALVTLAGLTHAELTEVPGSLGDKAVVELEFNTAEMVGVDVDVEENMGHDGLDEKQVKMEMRGEGDRGRSGDG